MNTESQLPLHSKGAALSPSGGYSVPPKHVRAASWVKRMVRSTGGVLATRGMLVLADQAIVSGTNFLTTLTLGRVCLPEQLGIYSNAFMVFLVLSAIPSALAWMPYTTFSPHMPERARNRYTGSVTSFTAAICLVTSLGLAIAAVVAATADGGAKLGQVLGFFSVASAFMLLREHSRRISLAGMDMGRLLAVDAIAAALQIGGLFVLFRAELLSAGSVYVAIAVAGCAAFTFWLYSMRGQMRIRKFHLAPDLVKNWNFGRWILASSLVATLGGAFFSWILTIIHGPGAAGLFAAALSVVFFANPLLIGVRNYFAPLTAQVYAGGGARALRRLVNWSSLGLVVLISPFVLVVVLWGDLFVEILFGAEYSGQGSVLVGICLSLLADTATIPMSFALTAINRADYMLRVSVVKLIVTVTLGTWLVYCFGPVGAGYGCFLAALPAVVMQWFALHRLLRPTDGQGSEAL